MTRQRSKGPGSRGGARQVARGDASAQPPVADAAAAGEAASTARIPDGGSTGRRSDGVETDDAHRAAAAALARAREAARAKGLRPGSRPTTRRRRRSEATFSGSNTGGRDPVLLGDGLDRLLLDRGWQVDIAAGSVMGRWPVIVGLDVARHCTPVTFDDGVLVVRADSTAWATQLRLMAPTLLQRLAEEAGEGVVGELRVVGPAAPSWSRGLRRSAGPGPRDTYG